jgi:hypothetical protein
MRVPAPGTGIGSRAAESSLCLFDRKSLATGAGRRTIISYIAIHKKINHNQPQPEKLDFELWKRIEMAASL